MKPNILKTFGLSGNVSKEFYYALTYVIRLYSSKKTQCTTLDEVRYTLASTIDKSATKLIPTDDTLLQQVKRVRYQASIWFQSHIPRPAL